MPRSTARRDRDFLVMIMSLLSSFEMARFSQFAK
jgi:hypothetical protein